MKRKIGLLIALLLLAYGLSRMCVGGALLAQTMAFVDFPDLAEGVLEVRGFFDERSENLIVPFSLSGYFSYIMAMGVLLAAGAIGAIKSKRWGFAIEVNPKLWALLLQAVLLFILYYLRPPKDVNANVLT